VPGDISGGAVPDLSQSRRANKSLSLIHGTAEDKAGVRAEFARILLVPLRSGSDLRKRNSEVF